MKRPSVTASLSASALAALLLTATAGSLRLSAEETRPARQDYAKLFAPNATTQGVRLQKAPNVLKLDKSRIVPVRITKKNACYFGDLDTIFLEMSWGKFTEVIMTLEPITGSGEIAGSASLHASKLGESDFTVELKAPAVAEPTLMGIFICKDTSKSGSCRNKKLIPFEDIYKKYAPEAKPENLNPKKDIPDKIYFFNHLVVSPDSIEAMDSVYDAAEQARVAGLLEQHPSKGDTALLERLGSLHKTLASVPLAGQDGALTATLPLSDFPNCGEPPKGATQQLPPQQDPAPQNRAQ